MESCSICLNSLDENTKTKTPCNHVFCKSCIYEWVRSHTSNCPTCRTRLNIYNTDQEYESESEYNLDIAITSALMSNKAITNRFYNRRHS